MKAFQSQTLYEVLEVSVGASEQELRGAYDRLTRLYGEDQVALYGLIEPGQAAEFHARLREALEVLIDDARRDDYDRSIGLPPRERATEPAMGSGPRPAEPTSSTGGWSQGYAWVTPEPEPEPESESESESESEARVAGQAHPVGLVAVPGPGAATPARPSVSSGSVGAAPTPSWVPPVGVPASPRVPIPRLPPGPTPAALAAPTAVVESTAVVAPAAVVVPAAVVAPPTVEVPPPPASAPLTPAAAAIEGPPAREPRPEPRLKTFELPAGVEFNGDLLRQVRLARGVSLQHIAERTRIGARHLENLEADRYEALPATVYLRGILMSLARELGLDGVRVARSYLQFVEAYRLKG